MRSHTLIVRRTVAFVFNDLEKNFEYLKGDVKEIDGKDTLYQSNKPIEGTKDNSIFVSSGLQAYQAIITDSTSEEGSQFILKAWRTKLADALIPTLAHAEKEYHSEGDKTIDGYQYPSDKIEVLLLRHKAGDNSYWINLVIKAK